MIFIWKIKRFFQRTRIERALFPYSKRKNHQKRFAKKKESLITFKKEFKSKKLTIGNHLENIQTKKTKNMKEYQRDTGKKTRIISVEQRNKKELF